VNACTLALVDAGIPMTDYVLSISAAIALKSSEETSDPLLDANGAEEQDLPSLTVATLGASEKITLLQLESKLPLTKLESMLAVAVDGCGKLREIVDGVVRAHGRVLIANTGVV